MQATETSAAVELVARYHAAPDDSPLQECILDEYRELTGRDMFERDAAPLGVGGTSRLIGDALSMSEDQRIACRESVCKLAAALDGAALEYLFCGAQVGIDTGVGMVPGVLAAMEKLTEREAAAIAGLAVRNAYQGMPREQ